MSKSNNEHHKDDNYLAYMRNIGFALKRGFIAYARPLAYTSELGEATRPVVPPWFVKIMYGITFAYVGVDIAIKTHETWKKEGTFDSEVVPYFKIPEDFQRKRKNKTLIKLFDTTVWHGFASILLPAVTIHTTVKFTGKIVDRFYTGTGGILDRSYKHPLPYTSRIKGLMTPRIIPTLVGLLLIPVIIHPLDHLTDYGMDKFIRSWYPSRSSLRV